MRTGVNNDEVELAVHEKLDIPEYSKKLNADNFSKDIDALRIANGGQIQMPSL